MRNTSEAKATWKNILALNLSLVRDEFNLQKGWWWRLWHNPLEVELEYRRFLFLVATNSDQNILPWSDDLNDFWLEHQRDAEAYAVDCYTIIGAVINRKRPGMEEGSLAHTTAWRKTRELYKAAFRRKPRPTTQAWNAGDSYDPGTYFGVHPDSGSHGNSGHHGAGGHSAGGHHGCASHSGGSHSCGSSHSCGGHGCGGHGCGGGH